MPPQKTKIPARVLVLIGIAIVASSIAMNVSNGYQRFTLFIVAGVVVFLYGVFRMITERGRKAVKKVEEQLLTPQQHVHYNRQPEQAPAHTPKKCFCPFCASPLHPQANFCQNCGNRL